MSKEISLSHKNDKHKVLIHQLSTLKKAKDAADVAKKELDSKMRAVSDMVYDFMENNKVNSIKFSNCFSVANKLAKIQKVERKTIDWDIDCLKENLSDSQFKKAIKKEYVIVDYAKVVELLKTYKVPPKEFVKYINCSKTVNQEALEQMNSLGEICMEDLRESFEVKIVSSYLKISDVKNDKGL